ncbi:Hypothetical predicted protein, partial [Cloeon dipterum]
MYKVQFLSVPLARVIEAKPQPPSLTIVCKTGSVNIQDAANYINAAFRKVYNPNVQEGALANTKIGGNRR